MYEASGEVIQIGDLQTFGSGFTKKEFVIRTADRYPQEIKFETVKDKTSLVDGISTGDQVTVSFDIRGNEFKGRHYVNLNAWKIEKGEAAASSSDDSGEPDIEDLRGDDMPF